MPETIRAVEMSRIGNSKTGRPAGPSARRRESGPVERRRAENCREHAAVAVTAPEHAAKETQRRSRGAKVLTPEPEHVALPENGQECRS